MFHNGMSQEQNDGRNLIFKKKQNKQGALIITKRKEEGGRGGHGKIVKTENQESYFFNASKTSFA